MVRFGIVGLFAALALGACGSADPGDPQPPVISGETPVQLLISDRAGDGVYRLPLGGDESGSWFTQFDSQGAARPGGLFVDGDRVYVAAFGSGDIFELDADTGDLLGSRFRDRRVLEEPVAMMRHEDTLWVLGNDTRNLVALDTESDVIHDCGSDLLGSPHDMVLGPDDRIYVATTPQADSPSPVQVWSTGDSELVAGFGGQELEEATAIAMDADQNIYVADAIGAAIHRFDREGQHLGTLGDGLVTRPISLALGGRTLYALDQGVIVAIDLDGDDETVVYPLPDELRQPRSIALY